MLYRARFPQFSVQCPFSQNLQCLQEKPIVTQVKMKIQDHWGGELEIASEDKSDGRYEFSFTPEFDGCLDVMISVNGRSLTVSPFRVVVSPCLYQKAFELGSNGQFLFPSGIAISKLNGNIAVADSLNKRIQIFDSEGKYLRQFGEIRDSKFEIRDSKFEKFAETLCSRI